MAAGAPVTSCRSEEGADPEGGTADVELYQIRYFLVLARCLNFTRAAEECGVTQSALTKAVHKLEAEFGGELIRRERNLSHLTDLGTHILPFFERSASAADKAAELARKMRRQEISYLRIALPPSISSTLITGALDTVCRRFPGLQIELLECNHQTDLPACILAGEADVGLSGEAMEEVPSRIDDRPLLEEEFLLLMHPSDPLAQHGAVDLHQLENARWLILAGCEKTREFLCRIASGPAVVTQRGRTLEDLQYMVAAGLGMMLAPRHYPTFTSIAARPIIGSPVWHKVRMLTVAGRHQPPPLRAFIAALRNFGMPAFLQHSSIGSAGYREVRRRCRLVVAGYEVSPAIRADRT